VVAETAAIVEVLRNDCVNYCINDCANYGINCCNTTPATAPLLGMGGGQSTPAVACEVEDAAATDARVGAIFDAILDALVAQYFNYCNSLP